MFRMGAVAGLLALAGMLAAAARARRWGPGPRGSRPRTSPAGPCGSPTLLASPTWCFISIPRTTPRGAPGRPVRCATATRPSRRPGRWCWGGRGRCRQPCGLCPQVHPALPPGRPRRRPDQGLRREDAAAEDAHGVTFVIDKQGVVRFRVDKVDTEEHDRQVLDCSRRSDGIGKSPFAAPAPVAVVGVAGQQREGDRRLAVDHLLMGGGDLAPGTGLPEGGTREGAVALVGHGELDRDLSWAPRGRAVRPPPRCPGRSSWAPRRRP